MEKKFDYTIYCNKGKEYCEYQVVFIRPFIRYNMYDVEVRIPHPNDEMLT